MGAPRRLSVVLLISLALIGGIAGAGLRALSTEAAPGVEGATGRLEAIQRDIRLSHVPIDQPLQVNLGMSVTGATATVNAGSFVVEAPDDMTGFIQVRRTDTNELVGLQYAPRIPGITYPRHPIDDVANAVSLIYLLPGMASTLAFADAMIVELATESRELTPLMEEMARQWSEGTNPLTAPDERTLVSAYALLADVNQRLLDVIASIEVKEWARSDLMGTPTGGLPIRNYQSQGSIEVTGTSLMRTAVNQSEPGVPSSIEVACESATRTPPCGLDEVYVNSREGMMNANDRAALLCLTPNTGFITDLDGLERDDACLAADTRSDDGSFVNMNAVNFAPRWLLAYTSENRSVFPDAVIPPKMWQLPSVIELSAILGNTQRVAAEEAVEFLCGFFGFGECELGVREDLVLYMEEVITSFATNGASSFALPIMAERDLEFEIIGLDYVDPENRNEFFREEPEESSSVKLNGLRAVIADLATFVDVIALPSVRLFLDLKSFRASEKGIDGRPSREELENRNRKTQYRNEAIKLVAPVLWAQLRDGYTACVNSPEGVASSQCIKAFGDGLKALFPILVEMVVGIEVGRLFEGRTKGSDRGLSRLQQLTDVTRVDEQALVQELTGSEAKEISTWGLAVLLDPDSILDATRDLPAFVAGEVQGALVQGISVALAATPPGRIAKAIELGLSAGGLVANVGELLEDGRRFDQVEEYRISAGNLRQLQSASDAKIPADLAAQQQLDLTVIVDTSGSMGDENKLPEAIESVNALIELLRFQADASGSRVSVSLLQFNNEPSWVFARTPVSDLRDGWTPQLTADGSTFVQPALKSAIDELKTVSSSNRRIILVTDGEASDRSAEQVIPNMLVGRGGEGGGPDPMYDVVAAGIRIDTIAFSFQDAESLDLLRTISAVSGGRTYEAAKGVDLVGAFIKARQEAKGETVSEVRGVLPTAGKVAQRIVVRPNADGLLPDRIVVSVYSPGVQLNVLATDPQGRAPRDEDIEYRTGKVTELVILNPMEGSWRIDIGVVRAASTALGGFDWGGVLTAVAHPGPILTATALTALDTDVSIPVSLEASEDSNPYYMLVTTEGDGRIPESAVTAARAPILDPRIVVAVLGAWLMLTLGFSLMIAVRMRRRTSSG